MIRLHRPAAPTGHAARASRATRKLWDTWHTTGEVPSAKSAIYAHSEVKQTLRDAQHQKCAYCETLNPTSHDVVEHFRPKNGWRQKRGELLQQPAYFWLSYDWDNLLFACDQCNDAGHKQNLFPLSNPPCRADAASPDISSEKPLLVNPYSGDPERHIEWNRDIPRPRKRSHMGRVTIEVFGLDRDGLLMDQRRKYLGEIEKYLALLESTPSKTKEWLAVKDVLLDCLEDRAPWAEMIRANFGARIQAL
jgi:uncharacterized protein (TIGR02646 family)